ncbi:MAG: hypothetical protein GY866_01105 [Proteobacteria bacterium]|nr:hypothetical protein [Pseudomonadota bacterium]
MRRKLLAIFISLYLFSGCSLLIKEAVLDARNDISHKDYKSALSSIDEVESDLPKLTKSQRAEALLLKALALHGLERHEEATEVLNTLVADYSDCDFSAQAKILLAKWNK